MRLLDQVYTDWIEKDILVGSIYAVGIDLKLSPFGVLIKPI